MFSFDKLVNSSFFKYADLLYKIIFINVMVVLLSLPIITFIPALIAGYDQIKFYIEENEAPLFKSFIQAFKRNFMRHMKIGIVMIVVALLLLNNINFFYEHVKLGPFYVAGLYFTLIVFFFFILMGIHIPLACIYFEKLETLKIFKISLYIGIKYIFTTLMMIIPIALTILLMLYSFPIFTFIGFGLSSYLNLKLSNRIYKRFKMKE